MSALSSLGLGNPAIRIAVLVFVLGVTAFAFYNDMRLAAEVDLVTAQFSRLEEAADETYTPEKVQSELKRKPNQTYQAGKYDVEVYRLRRTIPFFSFGSVYAIYENGSLFKVAQGERPTVESIENASGMGLYEQKEKKDLLK